MPDRPAPRTHPLTAEAAWLDEYAATPRDLSEGRAGPALRPAAPARPGSEHHLAAEHDWLGEAWDSLPETARDIAARTCAGENATALGYRLQVPVLEVRRLRRTATETLGRAQRVHDPDLGDRVDRLLRGRVAVPDRDVGRLMPIGPASSRAVLLTHLGAQHPTTWSGPVVGYWTLEPGALDLELRRLAGHAPFTREQAEALARESDLPADLPWWDLLSEPTSPLRCRPGGWIP
ncbi:hypothetical protein [Nocardioides alkalitolerans]|uniref:hypothetical protein n=1 Tax=Nocardioides alkalitolerans TaxID=281714 RepID=UPI0004282132|nr:hypothetical protein [Nocardioides alkalitolerans]